MSFYAPLLAVLYFGHVEVFVIIFDWRIRFVCLQHQIFVKTGR